MTQYESALTTLIGEVPNDPDLAHSDVFRHSLRRSTRATITPSEIVVTRPATHLDGERKGPASPQCNESVSAGADADCANDHKHGAEAQLARAEH
jgi:hypothetical protein